MTTIPTRVPYSDLLDTLSMLHAVADACNMLPDQRQVWQDLDRIESGVRRQHDGDDSGLGAMAKGAGDLLDDVLRSTDKTSDMLKEVVSSLEHQALEHWAHLVFFDRTIDHHDDEDGRVPPPDEHDAWGGRPNDNRAKAFQSMAHAGLGERAAVYVLGHLRPDTRPQWQDIIKTHLTYQSRVAAFARAWSMEPHHASAWTMLVWDAGHPEGSLEARHTRQTLEPLWRRHAVAHALGTPVDRTHLTHEHACVILAEIMGPPHWPQMDIAPLWSTQGTEFIDRLDRLVQLDPSGAAACLGAMGSEGAWGAAGDTWMRSLSRHNGRDVAGAIMRDAAREGLMSGDVMLRAVQRAENGAEDGPIGLSVRAWMTRLSVAHTGAMGYRAGRRM